MALLSALFVIASLWACRSDPTLQPETPAATSNSGSHGSELDFLHNPRKVEGFRFDPLPPRDERGRLPRGLNAFALGGPAPPDGKPYRDGQEVVFIENNLRSHRLRVFSRAGVIFRLQSHTLLDEADAQDHIALLNRIKGHYGEPARELTDELTWVDRDTVLVISIGGRYLITDIADAENGDFAPHIYELLDRVYR
jgi:hypothetical protein